MTAHATNGRRVWFGQLRRPYRQLVDVLARKVEGPPCAGCGAAPCVSWGHQYQPLACEAERLGRLRSARNRPELRAIYVNSRGVHVGRRMALFGRWHRVQ